MKPLPQSLYDRAELLARSHPLGTVAELIGVPASTLSTMKARGWKAVDYSCKLRKVPSDFAIQARHMKHAELARHYRASFHTIGKWFAEKPVRESWRGAHLKRGARG